MKIMSIIEATRVLLCKSIIVYTLILEISSISLVCGCSSVSSPTFSSSLQLPVSSGYLSDSQNRFVNVKKIINVRTDDLFQTEGSRIQVKLFPTVAADVVVKRNSAVSRLPKYTNRALFDVRGGDELNTNNINVATPDGDDNIPRIFKQEIEVQEPNQQTKIETINNSEKDTINKRPTAILSNQETKNLAFVSNSIGNNDKNADVHKNNQNLQKGLDSNMIQAQKHSLSISNLAKDVNSRLNQASTTVKRHGIKTLDKVHSLHGSSMMTLKSYMEAIKKKDFKLPFKVGSKDSSNSFYRRIELRNHIIAKMKHIISVTGQQCQKGTLIASNLLLGSGRLFQQDIMIWSIAFITSLLGTSLGFHSFLYFVTVGYSVSIGLIALASLIVFNVSCTTSRFRTF
jgi:hypothetical protein